MSDNIPRQPAGSPQGGQFAATGHAEADVSLGATPRTVHLDTEQDVRSYIRDGALTVDRTELNGDYRDLEDVIEVLRSRKVRDLMASSPDGDSLATLQGDEKVRITWSPDETSVTHTDADSTADRIVMRGDTPAVLVSRLADSFEVAADDEAEMMENYEGIGYD